jgi:hypothetical protein
MLCCYSRIFTIYAYKRGQECNTKSDLSLAALYWHVVACEICRNHIISHMFNSTHDEIEDTKGVIRIRKSNERQHKGKHNMDKWTNNILTFNCRSGGVVVSPLAWFYHPPRENRLCKYTVTIISKCCLSAILIENEKNRAHCTEYMNTGIVLSYLVVPIINSFIEVYC